MITPKKLAYLLVLATFAFAATPVLADCNDLTIEVRAENYEIARDIQCTHGSVFNSHRRKVVLTNDGLFGPDCTLAFTDDQGNVKSVVQIQQNYCGLAAGSITVTARSGEIPSYKAEEGSYWDGKGGKVVIEGFRPSAPATE